MSADGPRFGLLLGGHAARSRPGNGLRAWLARLESRYYAQIVAPDLLIVLKLDPDLATERKPEDRPDRVRARAHDIKNADWSQVRAEVIDASRPLDDLRSAVRTLVWSRL